MVAIARAIPAAPRWKRCPRTRALGVGDDLGKGLLARTSGHRVIVPPACADQVDAKRPYRMSAAKRPNRI